jgi:hypothetical protein
MPAQLALRSPQPSVSDQIDDLPTLRLVPVPDVGPPFDGELAAGMTVNVPPGQSWADEIDAVATPADALMSTAGIGRSESPGEWPRQFARLVTEALAGVRPVRQIAPWTSERARGHLRRLTPLFRGGQRPRVVRVIATRPTCEVIEMTVILNVGARTRALAVRLEHMEPQRPSCGDADQTAVGAWTGPSAPTARRWVCTDIEAA